MDLSAIHCASTTAAMVTHRPRAWRIGCAQAGDPYVGLGACTCQSDHWLYMLHHLQAVHLQCTQFCKPNKAFSAKRFAPVDRNFNPVASTADGYGPIIVQRKPPSSIATDPSTAGPARGPGHAALASIQRRSLVCFVGVPEMLIGLADKGSTGSRTASCPAAGAMCSSSKQGEMRLHQLHEAALWHYNTMQSLLARRIGTLIAPTMGLALVLSWAPPRFVLLVASWICVLWVLSVPNQPAHDRNSR
eukprot:scaffold195075_cov21-Prasinocladus_malaysianus.AAC.2